MLNEKFNFFVPIDLEKSSDGDEDEMRIRGIASTADEDIQGETLLPSGFVLKRFLESGFLNWNHTSQNDPSYIVGVPVKAEVTNDNKLYIEGVLYKDVPLARKVWELAKVLKRSKPPRSLGFSIEGVALERDFVNPKIVRKAEITGCAITPTPVNSNTFMEIVKGSVNNSMFVDYNYDTIERVGGDGVILKGLDVDNGCVYEVNCNLDIIKKTLDSVAVKPLTLEDIDGVEKLYYSIKILSEAMKEGLLSDEQVMRFKGILNVVKNMGNFLQ